MNWCWLITLLVLVERGTALYTSADDVIELTSSSFDDVTSGSEIWFVEFYAPWCGHCQSLAPEWKRAATILKGMVKVAAINAEDHADIASRYNVDGFPTILIFGSNKESPTIYHGGRTSEAIVNVAVIQLRDTVTERSKQQNPNYRDSSSGGGTCGGGSHSGGSCSDSGGSCGDSGGRDYTNSGDSEVIELTDANFNEKVLQSEDDWLVEFYAPWCGHCQSLKPHWESAAKSLKGKVKLGALDATVHNTISSRFGIRGFPTIRYFPAGVKSGEAEEYDSGRTSAEIVAWALEKAATNMPAPEVKELVSDAVAKDACSERQLCVIGVLPELLDCQSTCRNEYLAILKKTTEHFKKSDWGWLWTSANEHPELEQALQIGGSGFPALVALNTRKQKCAALLGPFNEAGIKDFLRTVSLGRGSTPVFDLKGLPVLQTVKPWNGKDIDVPKEDEIDLSELGIQTEL